MRTQTISTNQLKAFKIMAGICFLSIILFIIILFFFYRKAFLNGTLLTLAWTGLFYQRMMRLFKLKKVEFDESSLYYELKGYEEQIPFQFIKDIKLIAGSGIFEIQLFTPSQAGNSLYFKPSIWYPLNFGKVDEKVDRLRALVKANKKQVHPLQDQQTIPINNEPAETKASSLKS